MNKYRQAIERISVNDDTNEDWLNIEELVDRATPTKPMRQEKLTKSSYAIGYCECGEGVNNEFNYCPICGQALDWRKE